MSERVTKSFFLKTHIKVYEKFFVQKHHLRHKRLQMKNCLAPKLNSMLKESRRRNHFPFDFRVEFRKERESENADDDVSRDTVRKKFVQLFSDFEQALGALFFDNICGNALDDELPIWGFDWGLGAQRRVSDLLG